MAHGNCLEVIDAMSCKAVIPALIRISGILTYSALLIFWSWSSVGKYLDQPLATFVTYTQGDDNINLMFPHVTFCYDTLFEDQFLKNCGTEYENFETRLQECLIQNSEFDIIEYWEYLEEKATEFNAMIRSSGYLLDGWMFYQTFRDGAICYTFDPTNLDLMAGERYNQIFDITDIHASTSIWAYLHTDYDLLDAVNLYPSFYLEPTNFQDVEIVYKKIIKRDSTRKLPCYDYNKWTCQDIKVNQEIADVYGCKVPFFYRGKYLDTFIQGYENLPFCGINATLEGYELLHYASDNMPVECKDVVACQMIKFELKTEVLNNVSGSDVTSFSLGYLNKQEVMHETSYISYDFQSLIGELGGVVGMFLGLSGVSLNFYFAEWVERSL